MRTCKALVALIALLLLFKTTLPVAATGGGAGQAAGGASEAPGSLPLTWEAKVSVDWLRADLPQPAPGDEHVVLALLRSGRIAAGDTALDSYLNALLEVAAGDPAAQGLERCGWQALTLAAAGLDVNTQAPKLAGVFSDNETVVAAGLEAVRIAMLVFGPGGVQPQSGLNAEALAATLAVSRNLDGGYGANGTSDAQTSARMLQALAFYRSDATVESAVVDVRDWLRMNQADYGGFMADGSPSAMATAECAIALGCLLEKELQEGVPAPADALLVFHNEDGGFLPDPGSQPERQLTAAGLLALVGNIRLNAGHVPVYRMSDAAPAQGEEDTAFIREEAPISIPGLPRLSNGVLIGILLGTVALIVLLAALVSTGKDLRAKKKRRKRIEKLRASGQLPEGGELDEDDAFILDIDYEYVGDEMEQEPKQEESGKNTGG